MKSSTEFILEVRIRKAVFALLAGCFMLLSEHALAIDISDDFNDNKKNTAIWGADTKRGDGDLNEEQGRLEYTVTYPTPATADTFKRLLNARGPYNANWETQIDLVNSTIPSQDLQVNSFGIDMYHCEDPNDWLYAELYASRYSGPPPIKGFHSEFATDDVIIDWLDTGDLAGSSLLTGSVQIAFDSVTKIISVSYRYSDGDWIPFGSYDISAAGWSMTDIDQFCFKVYGWSERMRVTEDTMYGDNFLAKGFTPPAPQLLDPNGGEILPAGGIDYPITWEAPSDNVKFTLKYSIDKGLTWKTIDTGVTDTSYNWTVPVPRNNKRKCFVKVIGYDASNVKKGQDKSDAPFTIEVIRLTSPNQGEPALTSGRQHTITWTTNKTIAEVDHIILSYTLNDGLDWKAINTTADPSDDGSFVWIVPPITKAKTKCKVKIVLKDASGNTVGSDVSNGVFTIQLPSP